MVLQWDGSGTGPDPVPAVVLSFPLPSVLSPPLPPVPSGSQELGQPGLGPGSMPTPGHPQVGFAKDLGLWTERSPAL